MRLMNRNRVCSRSKVSLKIRAFQTILCYLFGEMTWESSPVALAILVAEENPSTSS